MNQENEETVEPEVMDPEDFVYLQWQAAEDPYETPWRDFEMAWNRAQGWDSWGDSYGEAYVGEKPDTHVPFDQVKSIFRERVDYGSEGVQGWEMGQEVGTEMTMVVLGELQDGRWFGLEAWNDYTGWDCQDGADIYIGESRIDVVLNGLTQEGRSALGIEVTPTALGG